MSAFSERGALDRPVSLFEHAKRLHALCPDDPIPDGGSPFPDDAGQPTDRVPFRERKAALAAALREFIGNPTSPGGLHDLCTRLTLNSCDAAWVGELVPEPSPRLLAAARWLVRDGTDRRAVCVGLALLYGHAQHRDVPMLKVIGRLCLTGDLAMQALTRIPGAERDVIWLAERSPSSLRTQAVRSLVGTADPTVREWVRSTPRELLSCYLARKIAHTHGLAELLRGPTVDHALWDQAGQLLLAMTSTHDYQTEIGRYPDAPEVYQRWVALADRPPPTLERAAVLAMVAEDLRTGAAALVVGQSRDDLLHRIRAVLSAPSWTRMVRDAARSGDPVAARRAAWVIAETAKGGAPDERFAVRVVVPDPRPVGFPQVEARVVIDGMPVVATFFDKGPADQPEEVVHSGQLRATSEPREVRLAEAYCTEGCCGALYVTITREGSEVVWRNWRSRKPGDPPPDVRFDAAEYDREIARAERDHSWEWPARTVARLVAGCSSATTNPSWTTHHWHWTADCC